MKQTIQLRLGQHLTMTPQLQQAIRLLQLSSVELQTEIQEALESNPMLETQEETERVTQAAEDKRESDSAPSTSERSESSNDAAGSEPDETPLGTGGDSEVIPEELPVDSSWDDIYDNPLHNTAPADAGADFEAQRGTAETLRDHLYWQLNLANVSERDRIIATGIIDSVNPDGYLGTTAEEIRSGLAYDELEVEADEFEAVLHLVQSFDPSGIAARDPRECMLIQLQQMDPDTPWREEARRLVNAHLDLLAGQQIAQLKRKMQLSEDQLEEAIRLVRSLDPRPGRVIEDNQTQYVVPDVFVRKRAGVWRVELNGETAPRLRINSNYANLVRRADSSDDNVYLKNHLQEARWFLKSLQSRNETLLKVASSIVAHQRAFLEYGEEAMRPLVLRDVAEDVSMHESTISRVTTQKYMHTPRGILEFKYFFSSHVNTTGGGECSATAIRALIRKLVAAEKPVKPLSDSKLAEILSEQGIKVARRTIAKYRESMSIPPSNERKRLI
jgi:RNA polymerase sigma-54 factor